MAKRNGKKRQVNCAIKKVLLEVIGKFYKTVVSPATMHGLECWVLNEKEEIKTKVIKKPPRWGCMCVTRLNRIRNGCIRGSQGVTNVE